MLHILFILIVFGNVFLYVWYDFSQFSCSDAFLSFRDVFLCPFSLLCFPLYWHWSVYLFSAVEVVEVTMTLQSWLIGFPMKQTISHSMGIFFPLIIILPKYIFNWTNYMQLEGIIVCYNLLRYIKNSSVFCAIYFMAFLIMLFFQGTICYCNYCFIIICFVCFLVLCYFSLISFSFNIILKKLIFVYWCS